MQGRQSISRGLDNTMECDCFIFTFVLSTTMISTNEPLKQQAYVKLCILVYGTVSSKVLSQLCTRKLIGNTLCGLTVHVAIHMEAELHKPTAFQIRS